MLATLLDLMSGAREHMLESAGWPLCSCFSGEEGEHFSAHSTASDLSSLDKSQTICCLGAWDHQRVWILTFKGLRSLEGLNLDIQRLEIIRRSESGYSNLRPGLWDIPCEFLSFIENFTCSGVVLGCNRTQMLESSKVLVCILAFVTLARSLKSSWFLVWIIHKLGLILILLYAVNSASLCYPNPADSNGSFGP